MHFQLFVRAYETFDKRGQNRTCVISQYYATTRLLLLSQTEIIFSRSNHEECGLSVEETDLLKSESCTASNMHGRGNEALSCSNLFPLINSRRSTGCHPLGWALAPRTTRPRSHDYGSLWGPSSNLCVQESLQTAASIHNLSHSNSFHKEHHSPRCP